jgi:hypothetical protein
MNDIATLAIVIGLVILAYSLFITNIEGFVQETTDKVNEKATVNNEVSSYRQETNHVKPTHPPYENPEGIETPFRVNQFKSFMPV